MSLQLHRPDGRGGLEPKPVTESNWRRGMQSRRWGLNRRDGKLPDLKNPEMNPTSTWISVGFWIGLGVLTFVILLAGYGTGVWHFPAPLPSPSAVPLPS